jgi:hypothetical protein
MSYGIFAGRRTYENIYIKIKILLFKKAIIRPLGKPNEDDQLTRYWNLSFIRRTNVHISAFSRSR